MVTVTKVTKVGAAKILYFVAMLYVEVSMRFIITIGTPALFGRVRGWKANHDDEAPKK